MLLTTKILYVSCNGFVIELNSCLDIKLQLNKVNYNDLVWSYLPGSKSSYMARICYERPRILLSVNSKSSQNLSFCFGFVKFQGQKKIFRFIQLWQHMLVSYVLIHNNILSSIGLSYLNFNPIRPVPVPRRHGPHKTTSHF